MTTVNELLELIKKELVAYGKGRVIRIELSNIMFYKAIKLIQFCVRDKEDEPYRNIEHSDKWKRFEVDINNKHFVFTKEKK